jgi:ketosteroid isomerase-like protein
MDNQNQIKELITNWAAAVRDKDIEKIMAFHSDDMVMYDVPEPFQSVGLEAYRKTWELFFRYTNPGVFDIQEMHIVADENVGFAFAKMVCEDKSHTKEFVPLDFRLTVGLKKINGQWTILHEHHSVPATI